MLIQTQATENSGKPGPKPDRLKIEEDWENAIKKALRKERPQEGWPEPEKPKSDEESHSGGESEGK
jgi:hypothetical protein